MATFVPYADRTSHRLCDHVSRPGIFPALPILPQSACPMGARTVRYNRKSQSVESSPDHQTSSPGCLCSKRWRRIGVTVNAGVRTCRNECVRHACVDVYGYIDNVHNSLVKSYLTTGGKDPLLHVHAAAVMRLGESNEGK